MALGFMKANEPTNVIDQLVDLLISKGVGEQVNLTRSFGVCTIEEIATNGPEHRPTADGGRDRG